MLEWSPSPLHNTRVKKQHLDDVRSLVVDEEGDPKTQVLSVDDEIEHLGFGRYQTVALLVLGLANASDAVELLCLSFILPNLTTEGGTPLTSSNKAALSSAIFLGMLAGGLVFGVAADSLGRRTTLAFSLAINSLFGFLAASSPRFEALLICRVLAGFGVGGSIPGVFTLAAEVLPTLNRGFWLSTVAWWWMVGAVYTAGVAWVMMGAFRVGWQWFAAVCAIPAGVAAALVLLLLQESPRFLHTSGDGGGARDALVKMARASGKESRLAVGRGWRLVEVPHSAAAAVAGAAAGGAKVSSSSSSLCPACFSTLSLTPIWDFFSPPNRRVATLLCVVWFCLSLGWYGLMSWLPSLFKAAKLNLDVYQDSFLVTAAYLPGNVVSAVLMERIGRRGVLAVSLLLACLSALCFPFATSEATVVLAACVLNAVSTCSWNALDVLSAESFPTSLRTTAIGLLAATGRLGSIAGQWIFGSLIDVSVVALLSSAGLFLGIGAIAAWLLPPEVKSVPLEEVSGGGRGGGGGVKE